MGRAYAGRAVAHSNVHQWEEANEAFKLAMASLDHMSERERFRTRASYYIFIRDADKAIDEYTQLMTKYPGDSAGLGNLALAYFYKRDMAKALSYGRRAVEASPKQRIWQANV